MRLRLHTSVSTGSDNTSWCQQNHTCFKLSCPSICFCLADETEGLEQGPQRAFGWQLCPHAGALLHIEVDCERLWVPATLDIRVQGLQRCSVVGALAGVRLEQVRVREQQHSSQQELGLAVHDGSCRHSGADS